MVFFGSSRSRYLCYVSYDLISGSLTIKRLEMITGVNEGVVLVVAAAADEVVRRWK